MDFNKRDILETAKEVVDIEINEICELKSRINDDFYEIVELIYNSQGRIVITGVGKSGIIGMKIAASLASTGTNAFFMHSGEALHGDLGMVYKNDIVIAISNSGKSQEILDIIPSLKKIGATLIAMTGDTNSQLAKEAKFTLDIGVKKEACPLDLAPTSSTTATLVMGDALVVALIKRRNFKPEGFALYHPGGALGRRLLTRIEDLMHNEIPRVNINDDLSDIIYEISSKRLGMTLVYDDNKAIGIITDGDIRRGLSKFKSIKELNAKDLMSYGYKKILENEKATIALEEMQKFKVSSLVVVNHRDENNILGIITMHDLFPFIK